MRKMWAGLRSSYLQAPSAPLYDVTPTSQDEGLNVKCTALDSGLSADADSAGGRLAALKATGKAAMKMAGLREAIARYLQKTVSVNLCTG